MTVYPKMLAICMIAFFIINLITGCSKSSPDPSHPAPVASVTISSLNLTTGPYNTLVTITGTGFDATAVNNQVYFNGVAATVFEVISNQLLVYVPLAAGTGPVTVKVNGSTATGPVFTYQVTEVVTTFAGQFRQGNADGMGTAASFNEPAGLTTDAAGNVYVADMYNNLIRKITPAGLVTTVAGSGSPGSTDGAGRTATFNRPSGIAVDATGNIYVAEFAGEVIRKIDPTGLVSTLAGDGFSREKDGNGAAAEFSQPVALTIDATGNLYVADGRAIRKVSPAGQVTTIAGFGGNGITIDKSGNLYVSDQDNSAIKKITPGGVLSVFASGATGANVPIDTAPKLSGIYQIAIDASGNLFVTETGGDLIAKVTLTGVVTNFAGNGDQQYTDGAATVASFIYPVGITVDNNGNVYVADGHIIRKIFVQ